MAGILRSQIEPSPDEFMENFGIGGLSKDQVQVKFQGVKTGTTFTKKCYVSVEKQYRGIGQWVVDFAGWDPHLSLL